MEKNNVSDSKNVTWEQLLDAISHGNDDAEKAKWMIFRYLQKNYKEMDSVIARTLLTAYMKMHVKEPSLINSCMLGMAVKISEMHHDFKLPNFLKEWGYADCLRAKDYRRETDKDGRPFLSLKERVERAVLAYKLYHPEESRDGCEGIVSMYAVKVFEKEKGRSKRRYVKLVAPNGSSFIADSHQFPCRPWEISGRMFDILTRVSKTGKERAADIVLSQKRVGEVFSAVVGYVDYIDENHGQIHVYDSLSRHFVADKKTVNPLAKIPRGSFVGFCPIIVNGDHFKSAAIIAVMDKQKGCEAFGTYEAIVDYVNANDCYIRYTIKSMIRNTPEGAITPTGFASTASLPEEIRKSIGVGAKVHLILFLKRGKDGVKHNYVAEILCSPNKL